MGRNPPFQGQARANATSLTNSAGAQIRDPARAGTKEQITKTLNSPKRQQHQKDGQNQEGQDGTDQPDQGQTDGTGRKTDKRRDQTTQQNRTRTRPERPSRTGPDQKITKTLPATLGRSRTRGPAGQNPTGKPEA